MSRGCAVVNEAKSAVQPLAPRRAAKCTRSGDLVLFSDSGRMFRFASMTTETKLHTIPRLGGNPQPRGCCDIQLVE
jgi:hypothetical protein